MSDADALKHRRDKPRCSQSQSRDERNVRRQKSAPAGLLAGYKRGARAFDECSRRTASFSALREACSVAGGIGRDRNCKRRADTCRRLVHEHGITYNVYGDPRGMERPWQLDPFRSSSRRTNGARSKPDSSSARRC
jgi:hypothetical protein